jgi:lipid II:glycine glycyltransferase (peptidoglycan interpeptide bridge formation enzyme)
MHRHHRRLVRKAEAAGISVHIETGPAELHDFAAVYEETMTRLGASTFYFFPEEYWRRLKGGLGDRIVLIEARLDGRTLGSVLCLATPPWLHYHLGATSEEARGLGVSHLLLYSAARFGAQRAYDQLHLGSGLGTGGGSLLEFKQRFCSAPLLEQWLGKAVHDVRRYLELTGSEAVAYEGFFPAYKL